MGEAAIGMTVFTLLPFVVICLLGKEDWPRRPAAAQ